MIEQSRYPKQVFWSDEDEGYIAIASDLPGCSAFGESEAEALTELDHAIEAWIEAAQAAGNPIPAPSRPAVAADFSGKLLVRMPRTLHKRLAEDARTENVSLNQFIVMILAEYRGASEYRAMAGKGTLKMSPPVTVGRYQTGSRELVLMGASHIGSGNPPGQISASYAGGSTFRILNSRVNLSNWCTLFASSMIVYSEELNEMSGTVVNLDETLRSRI